MILFPLSNIILYNAKRGSFSCNLVIMKSSKNYRDELVVIL